MNEHLQVQPFTVFQCWCRFKFRNTKIQIKMLRKTKRSLFNDARNLSLSRGYTSKHQSAYNYLNSDSGAPCIKPRPLVSTSMNCSSCCVQVARGPVRANHSVNWRLTRDIFCARDWSERGKPANRPIHFKQTKRWLSGRLLFNCTLKRAFFCC